MIADEIHEKLASLSPLHLEIVDESESHRGHAGYREGGQTHFRVSMTSRAFSGLTRIQRHRLIYQTLGDIVPRIHALTLDLNDA